MTARKKRRARSRRMANAMSIHASPNPTVAMFEERLRLIEGAEACRATGTGMAAVFAALMCQLKAGDHVVAARALFGSCRYIVSDLLPRYGIDVTIIDGTDAAAWEAALSRPTAAVFMETPSNPTLEIIDLPAVAEMAHEAGAQVIVDNVFATPLLQRPLELGADIVVYSATKHIDGQGRSLGGAILGRADFCTDILKPFMRHTGPSLSPFNAWVLLKGLETLELRVTRHVENAEKIARHLAGRSDVSRVLFPSLERPPPVRPGPAPDVRRRQCGVIRDSGGQGTRLRLPEPAPDHRYLQ